MTNSAGTNPRPAGQDWRGATAVHRANAAATWMSMSRRMSPATPTARPDSAPSRFAPDDNETAPAHSPAQRKYSLGISGIGKREYQYCGTRLVSSKSARPAAHGPARPAVKLANAH